MTVFEACPDCADRRKPFVPLACETCAETGKVTPKVARMAGRISELEIQLKVQRDILDTPIVEPFTEAVVAEAKHQRARWGDEHDVGKDAFDWFWALGYLGGKAARADNDGDTAKALHHTVTAAALLANWHRHLIFRRDNGKSTEA